MFLLIIGVVIFFVSLGVSRTNPAFQRYAKTVQGIGLLIAVLGIIAAGTVQIEAGEVGVQKLFGKIQNNVLSSGLHLINPLVEVQHLDIRTQNYTMSGISNEGNKQGDDAIRVLSADGLEVTIDLSVLYHVIPSESPKLLRETGADYEDKIVRPITRTRIRDNAVYYDAVALFSTKRDEFQQRILATIEKDFRSRGLLLENLLIRNITLPQSVKTSIEQKINAEQDAQKMQFVLQKEQQEAQRKRVEAQGIADYQRIISESLTDKQLQYERIKAQLEIAKSPNSKVIIMGSGNTPVILDSKDQK
ncbi:MAG: prohibitin family protein [Bacteroidota bacterium]|nr:prohibitin family protein [Bacteroidota bacterium]